MTTIQVVVRRGLAYIMKSTNDFDFKHELIYNTIINKEKKKKQINSQKLSQGAKIYLV